LGIALAVGLVTGCTVDAASNTGIRLNVTFHDSIPTDSAATLIDTLRFYVAVQHPDHDVYVLNDAASGIVVDVTERDLFADPYQLLVGRSSPQMDRIRVVVVGERNGVGVVYGQLTNPELQDFEPGAIVQRTIELRPADQSFDMSWTVTGCLISSPPRDPEYVPFTFGSLADMDCDGWETPEDCDDTNPDVNPGVEEGYDCDGVDNDCDGVIDPGGNDDFDLDGVSACQGDCNDYDPSIHPDAPEICDAQDNDCDGKCDNAEGIDVDRDGFADCGEFGSYIDHEAGTCARVPTPDCNDHDPEVHPGAEERCNGRDDNCNGLCDEGLDPDGDGYTACGSWDPLINPTDGVCVALEPRLNDCAPEDGAVNPDTPDLCDGVDTNCDGVLSNAITACYQWGSMNGECMQGTMFCDEGGGDGPWGACGGGVADLVPLARCGIWHYCEQTPDPALCMDQSVHWHEMMCHLRYYGSYSSGLCGGPGSRPIYYLPFGFTGNNECTWHLLLQGTNNNYQEIGLVDPGNPGQPPASVLHSCEAALVVTPNAGMTTTPGTVTAFLSFYYDNGGGDFYALEMLVTVDPMTECLPGSESLTCMITN
jgi:hypothetical protein